MDWMIWGENALFWETSKKRSLLEVLQNNWFKILGGWAPIDGRVSGDRIT